jgi:hypothetical protein
LKPTRDNLALILAVEQLTRIGFTGDKLLEVKSDGWYERSSWPSLKAENDFKKYALKLIKDTYKVNNKTSRLMFETWSLGFGIKSFKS